MQLHVAEIFPDRENHLETRLHNFAIHSNRRILHFGGYQVSIIMQI